MAIIVTAFTLVQTVS